jgi:hypothetical protein
VESCSRCEAAVAKRRGGRRVWQWKARALAVGLHRRRRGGTVAGQWEDLRGQQGDGGTVPTVGTRVPRPHLNSRLEMLTLPPVLRWPPMQ